MPTATSRDGTTIAYDESGAGQPLVLVDPAAGHRGFGPLEGLRPHDLASIATPTLVMASQASDERLRSWARRVAERLPNGTHRELPGEWHGVAPSAMRDALVEFFASH